MIKKDWDTYFDAVRSQNWAGAKNALKRILAEEHDNPRLFLRLGDACQKEGDFTQAIDAYHRSARLLREQGFGQKAAALYKIILRLDPRDREALFRSSEIFREMELSRHAGNANLPARQSSRRHPGETAGPEEEATARVPGLFSGISEDEFRRMRKEFEALSFSDGDKVIEEGDSGDSLFLIDSGRAKVVAHLLGREIELAILGEGDVFGEVAFLTGRPRTAGVVAVGLLRVWQIGRLAVEGVIEKNPSVLSVLEDFYEGRVRDTIKKAKPE
jgi:CRP-like cAMP-binding protein